MSEPILPEKEQMKEFFQTQREQILTMNVQNYFTKKRLEKVIAKAEADNDHAELAGAQQEMEKVEKEFDRGNLYLEVIKEELTKV